MLEAAQQTRQKQQISGKKKKKKKSESGHFQTQCELYLRHDTICKWSKSREGRAVVFFW